MNKYLAVYDSWDKRSEEVLCSQPMMRNIILALADRSGIDSDEIDWKYKDGVLVGAEFKDDCGNLFTMELIKQ